MDNGPDGTVGERARRTVMTSRSPRVFRGASSLGRSGKRPWRPIMRMSDLEAWLRSTTGVITAGSALPGSAGQFCLRSSKDR